MKAALLPGLMLALLNMSGTAGADTGDWAVSPYLGLHSPRLGPLNKGAFRSPLPVRGALESDSAEGGVRTEEFMVENPLPEMTAGTEAGIEISLDVDRRNSFFLGVSGWESGSTSALRSELPFQGALTPVGLERSARISYFQYFLGWQHRFRPAESRFNFYSRVALHEVIDIKYREDMVLGFEPPGGETFNRLVVTESRGDGHYMLQLGLGGEYRPRAWLSFAADLGYTVSANRFFLDDATQSQGVLPEDGLELRPPVAPGNRQRLEFLSRANAFDDVSYRGLELDFDGWRTQFRVNVHF